MSRSNPNEALKEPSKEASEAYRDEYFWFCQLNIIVIANQLIDAHLLSRVDVEEAHIDGE